MGQVKKNLFVLNMRSSLKYSEWSFKIILSLSMSKLPPREMSSVLLIPTPSYILHCGDPRVETSFPFLKIIHELNKNKC